MAPASEIAHAQPADLEPPLALSRPINTPRPRIPKRGAAEAFDLEWPERREYDNPEAKKAELERLVKGLQVAYQRKNATAEEMSQLQKRLTAETKNFDEWQIAHMEALRDAQEDAEAHEPARRKRA
ncbi:MAG: hypothetical protein Q9171_001862 [Xanthocarpia ochracea]